MPDAYLVLQYVNGKLTVTSASLGQLPATAGEAETLRARGTRRAELCGKEGCYVAAAVSVQAPVPSAAQIRAWLRSAGWTEDAPGSMGSLWRGPAAACVGVVHGDGDRLALEGALTRIAEAEGRPAWEVALDMAAMDARAGVA